MPPQSTWLHNVVTVEMALTALPVVIFVLNYFVRSKWYKNPAGWNMLLFMAVVGEFLILGLYYRLAGVRAPDWVAVICWAQLLPIAWWRLYILAKAQYDQTRAIRRAEEGQHEFEKHSPLEK